MSAEKIIERIQNNAEKEIQQIKHKTDAQIKTLQQTMQNQTNAEVEKIRDKGRSHAENIKKIIASKAIQDVKRSHLNAREELIDECFNQAYQKLIGLQEERYKKIIRNLMKAGKQTLGTDCTVLISRDIDKTIAEQEGIPVKGTVKASGGVILQSANGTITIDSTFESLLNRKKDDLRIQVGRLLFPK